MKLIFPIVPPHPSLIVPASHYKKNDFETKYKIAADYEYKLRILRSDVNLVELPLVLSEFTFGGVSTRKNFKAVFAKRLERLQIDVNYNSAFWAPFLVAMFLICLMMRK